jgi:hypothetical protein
LQKKINKLNYGKILFAQNIEKGCSAHNQVFAETMTIFLIKYQGAGRTTGTAVLLLDVL